MILLAERGLLQLGQVACAVTQSRGHDQQELACVANDDGGRCEEALEEGCPPVDVVLLEISIIPLITCPSLEAKGFPII